MSDIVERLRREGVEFHEQLEAAAEIERLRSERLAFATESEERRERIDTLIAERDAERKTYNNAIDDLIADNARLRAILRDLRPDIERLEFCEASAEDGNTPRLQMLRRALEPKP